MDATRRAQQRLHANSSLRMAIMGDDMEIAFECHRLPLSAISPHSFQG